MFRKKGDRELESRLRKQRPEARDGFVRELGAEVEQRSRPPRYAGSRIAFAAALTSVALGAFAAFGGATYASTGAGETADVVKRVVSLTPTVRTQTPAADQYRPGAGVAPAEVEVAQPEAAPFEVTTVERLPFTGLPLVLGFAVGALLMIGGFALRRVEGR